MVTISSHPLHGGTARVIARPFTTVQAPLRLAQLLGTGRPISSRNFRVACGAEGHPRAVLRLTVA